MAGDTSKKSEAPGWYAGGIDHIWLPYTQMKTAAPPSLTSISAAR